jgi:hypothetical protein
MSSLFRVALLAAAAIASASIARGQRDVGLETLIRASENRIGVYAFHATLKAELALNADVLFPVGRLATLLDVAERLAAPTASQGGAASRPIDAPELVAALRGLSTPNDAASIDAEKKASPRALARVLAALRARAVADRGGPAATVLFGRDADFCGGATAALYEVGGVANDGDAPTGMASFAATASGDVVVCVLTDGFRSKATAAALLPTLAAACVARLGYAPPRPVVSDDLGPVEATLHEARRHASLFSEAVDRKADPFGRRRGVETSAFSIGETARVAVVALPRNATSIAVEWRLPGKTDDRVVRRRFIEGRTTSDEHVDLRLDHTGTYSVRVVVEGRVVMERDFFVTGP